MKKRKIIALYLSIIMMLGILAACTSEDTAAPATPPPAETNNDAGTTDAGEENTNEPDVGTNFDWSGDTSPITLSVYVNASWFNLEWITDIPTRSTAYITEKTGVTVDYVVPLGDEVERLNTMIASRSLPDILLIDDNPMIAQMIEAGLFLDLTTLADQYDSTFYDVVGPGQIELLRRDCGGVFDYPNFSTSIDGLYKAIEEDDRMTLRGYVSDSVFVVRKDMYEAIGSPDMTTPEGFINALSMAREMFPTCPHTGLPMEMIDFYSFQGHESNGVAYLREFAGIPMYNPDGTLHDHRTNPEFIKWMKTYRLAYEMGLISRNAFIDDLAAIMEKEANGQYFITFAGRARLSSFNRELFNTFGGSETDAYYIPIDAMLNSNGDQAQAHAKVLFTGWMNSFISTSAGDPARALRFLNFVNGPIGQHVFTFGIEGVTFDIIDGVEVMKDFTQDGTMSPEEIGRDFQIFNEQWTWWNNDWQEPFWAHLNSGVDFDPDFDVQDFQVDRMVLYPEFSLGIVLEVGSDEAIAEGLIDDLWLTTVVELLTAPSDEAFDQILEAFVNRRNDLGFQLLQEVRLEHIMANRAKLGMD
jgi:putative aldouronate transport system substrate-binding protein